MLTLLTYTVLFFLEAAAFPGPPYAHFASKARVNESSRTVDLGYARYQGWYNESAGLNIFQGHVTCLLERSLYGEASNIIHSIRFAQSTTGNLRWQTPRAPDKEQDSLIQADTWPAQCPQSPGASDTYTPADNSQSSEDCLFLNVGMMIPIMNCARC